MYILTSGPGLMRRDQTVLTSLDNKPAPAVRMRKTSWKGSFFPVKNFFIFDSSHVCVNCSSLPLVEYNQAYCRRKMLVQQYEKMQVPRKQKACTIFKIFCTTSC